MKISTRLNLFSLATILVMTAAVLGAAVFFLQGDLRQSRERLMQLELNGATQSIRQQLGRSGVVAASREAAEQLRLLRGKEGFASATLFVVEKNDSRVIYHPDAAMGERVSHAFVHEMLRRQAGSVEYDYKGDPRNEYLAYYRLGVDGVFTDFTDTAIAARTAWLKEAGR